MPWDDSKTTEDGDGTVDADEQLSAAEWNAHVADQKRRPAVRYTNREQQNQRTLVPEPEFTKQASNPILDGGTVGWTSAVGWCAYLHADTALANPLGEHYLYYFSHATEGMGLAYTNDLTGAWTDHGRVLEGSVATGGTAASNEGDVIHTPGVGLHAYLNDANSNVSRWVSTDGQGTSWSLDTQNVIQNPNHSGYPRVFRVGGRVYLSHFINNSLRVLSVSETGTGDWTRIARTAGAKLEPTGNGTVKFENYDYIPYFDGYLVAYAEMLSTTSAEIRLGYTTDGVNIDDWGAFVTPTDAWEGTRLYFPHLFVTNEGRVGLFYSADSDNSSTTDRIGLAIDTADVLA